MTPREERDCAQRIMRTLCGALHLAAQRIRRGEATWDDADALDAAAAILDGPTAQRSPRVH